MSGRIISRAESWETVYQAFQNINFTAFDYQTIKQSMIDYIKLYFKESFNDFIESSEFIALIELFAYLGEITAYRIDMAAHENFLPTAQRKQSILRLAKLISYNASRNIPARGLVKITSISTTEPVFDTRGVNLAGKKITWNDPSNPYWKEQFVLVIDKVLKQPFGSALPNDRVQVQDVLFELYTFNNIPLDRGVIPFTVNVSGQIYPMEIVPSALNEHGPYEKRPEIGAPLTLLYGSDGLGDGSLGTGFFFFVKQGNLQLVEHVFDGITPNQTFQLGINNINETDVWVNNVDPDTLEIVTGDEAYIRNNRAGEWVPVDLAHAQNIIYNTNIIRNKYEIETLENDDIRVIFGDGEFASIPSGLFHFWVRTSANEDLVIPQSAINNVESNFSYVDVSGIVRTFTFTFSAQTSFQNAAKSEDIEHIRRMAPSVYYTQDRMVNGRDYNTFMLQDQTILKIRSFNRTFAGESNYVNYVNFHDPSGAYDNVKIFGDDLALYKTTTIFTLPEISPNLIPRVVVKNYVEPLLSDPGLYLARASGRDSNINVRIFSESEFENIVETLEIKSADETMFLGRDSSGWVITTIPNANTGPYYDREQPEYNTWYISITKGADNDPWIVKYKNQQMIAESPETKFWFAENRKTINYDSLDSGNDVIVVLKANANKDRTGVLPSNKNMIVLGHNFVKTGEGPLTDIGLPNIHQFSVVYEDQNQDAFPDLPPFNVPLSDLINPVYTVKNAVEQEIIFDFPVLCEDIVINGISVSGCGFEGGSFTSSIDTWGAIWGGNWGYYGDVITVEDVFYSQPGIVTGIKVTGSGNILIKEYVYFTRPDSDSYWKILPTNEETLVKFLTDTENQYKREEGRYPMNFMWMHRTPNNHLVDPAAMNIIDTYIITRGYYISMRRWLDGYLPSRPSEPSSLELRTAYSYLIDNKMISDSLVLHSGKFKILFGPRAQPELQAKFKVIRSPYSTLTDNQIKLKVIAAIKDFFDISKWEFSETFYFTELGATIHAALPVDIESVVLVPLHSNNFFGDLFQIHAREDELFMPDVGVEDVEIIQSITRTSIRQVN